MRFVIGAVLLALTVQVISAQTAQPPADPAFMQKALSVLQQQRNNAQDQLAAEQARRLMVEEEVTKLKADAEAAKKTPEAK